MSVVLHWHGDSEFFNEVKLVNISVYEKKIGYVSHADFSMMEQNKHTVA